MYDLIVRTRRLNKLKVALVILVVVLITLIIFTSIRLVQMYNVSKTKYAYDLWINEVNAQISAREEAEKARFASLNEEELERFNSIYKHQDNKRVFLTFDDGPSSTVTPLILDTLKAENIKATFFLLGSRVELNPEIVKREYEEGHYLASHGYSHVYSQIYASPQSVLDEYNNCIRAIQNAIGVPEYNPHLFRFPGGFKGGKYSKIKEEAHNLLEQNNIVHVDWNALTSDAAGAKTTEEFIAQLEKTVPKYNSVVVLMHDAGNKKATAEALPTIISYFRERGYEFENFYSIIK